jgi:hypothetical protein
VSIDLTEGGLCKRVHFLPSGPPKGLFLTGMYVELQELRLHSQRDTRLASYLQQHY